eukprot:ANDGO_03507.mRNA.1 hypothetical protein
MWLWYLSSFVIITLFIYVLQTYKLGKAPVVAAWLRAFASHSSSSMDSQPVPLGVLDILHVVPGKSNPVCSLRLVIPNSEFHRSQTAKFSLAAMKACVGSTLRKAGRFCLSFDPGDPAMVLRHVSPQNAMLLNKAVSFSDSAPHGVDEGIIEQRRRADLESLQKTKGGEFMFRISLLMSPARVVVLLSYHRVLGDAFSGFEFLNAFLMTTMGESYPETVFELEDKSVLPLERLIDVRPTLWNIISEWTGMESTPYLSGSTRPVTSLALAPHLSRNQSSRSATGTSTVTRNAIDAKSALRMREACDEHGCSVVSMLAATSAVCLSCFLGPEVKGPITVALPLSHRIFVQQRFVANPNSAASSPLLLGNFSMHHIVPFDCQDLQSVATMDSVGEDALWALAEAALVDIEGNRSRDHETLGLLSRATSLDLVHSQIAADRPEGRWCDCELIYIDYAAMSKTAIANSVTEVDFDVLHGSWGPLLRVCIVAFPQGMQITVSASEPLLAGTGVCQRFLDLFLRLLASRNVLSLDR